MKKVSESDLDLLNNITSSSVIIESKIKYKNGEEYEGEIINGEIRQGWGSFKYHNGDIYEGYFKSGVREGIGEYSYADGSVYRGEWLNDMKNGKGTFQVDNKEFDGIWENDNFIEGIIYKVNSIQMNEQIINKLLDEDDYIPSIPVVSINKSSTDINSFRTPIKITKNSSKNMNNKEFKLDSPSNRLTKTPLSLKKTNIYKDLKYYESEYDQYIEKLLNENKNNTEHTIDLDIRSCNLKNINLTKAINKIMKNKIKNSYHYDNCKGLPCLCATIQNFLWN